jgi:hypothetical protein
LRLDAVLLFCPRVGDEETAVRALESLMTVRAAAQELRLEGLVAVGAHDLVGRVRARRLGHAWRIATTAGFTLRT